MSTIELDVAREMHRARVEGFEGTRRAQRAVAARRLERRAARLSRRAERVSRRAERAVSRARLAVARAL